MAKSYKIYKELNCWFVWIFGILTFLFAGFLGCDNRAPAKQSNPVLNFILSKSDLPDYEKSIDHAALISREYNWEIENNGTTIYRNTCYSCHGNEDQPGSLPNSKKFWKETFKNGSDPYSMYQTITRGFGQMPPHMHLAPVQKYDVIQFIREEFIKDNNPSEYTEISEKYLAGLPKGVHPGPEPQPYHPWSDMDYGNWFIHCYELADDNDPPKVISGGRSPLPNEDYSKVNFAYKGIAVRLDEGEGGVSKGNAFVLFDHDLLRFVGAWTGEGFIDWQDILLNDEHNVYPRTVGKRLFANPVGPGWANPATGDFSDPRFRGLDGRPFGPLSCGWAHYKGLYRYENLVIVKYTVGEAEILETWAMEKAGKEPILSRSLSVRTAKESLKMRVAPIGVSISLVGDQAQLEQEDGFSIIRLSSGKSVDLKILFTNRPQTELEQFSKEFSKPENLEKFTNGSSKKYAEVLTSPIIRGNENDPYAVDVFVLPQANPWKSRLRLTGIDFLAEGKEAVVTTIDGEVWRVEGILGETGETKWHRIATGLFQPLGIIVQEGDIYVGCRDQIVILRDLNDDGETDFYESFNSDHQVTEHFHEFAMGLQTDASGNFYYAKSGRHARTSLVPQHGTLIKVSPDGKNSEILANGFRAANGVCLNPDGSFYVTDQQGYWNPMNRINRVTKGGFYGNMWGYGAPADSSDASMVMPMAWIDMKYDRSPAELLWADTEKWGPLSGSLLNLSYGYGKIYNVLIQDVGDIQQGGMIEIPVPTFPTGIMRARFNPTDGQMYTCGMSAWATDRMIQVGGLYRVRYTGKPFCFPQKLEALEAGLQITFSESLDKEIAENPENYTVNTWDIKRTSKYGSKRYNTRSLKIEKVSLDPTGNSITIFLPEIQPSWIMEIIFKLESEVGDPVKGAIQNTVYKLKSTVDSQPGTVEN